MNYGLYNEDPVIKTYSGIWFNPIHPTPDMIIIEDIAHALSHQCRFGGHVPKFYSVAQHSYECSLRVRDKLSALLHDASEAYLIDIPRPIKQKLTNYKEIEDNLMKIIASKFGFQYPLSPEVKEIDEIMLQLEWENFMIHTKSDLHILADPKKVFLQRFKELSN